MAVSEDTINTRHTDRKSKRRVDEIMKIIDICAADVIIKDALLMPTVRLYHPVVK